MPDRNPAPGVQQVSSRCENGATHEPAFVPELPSPGQRWTVRRKAAVIEAVRGGWVPVEEVSRLYDLSADEILAWERDLDRYGVPGLRTTRLQIYRNTDNAKRGDPPAKAMRTRFLGGMRYRRLA
jgi:hypothetical protein